MAADLYPMFTEEVLSRVCAEYMEMPGLQLTRPQAQRLWGLDERTCAQILELLVEAKFLRRSRTDSYARCTDGTASIPRLRMAAARFDLSSRSRIVAR